jgi:hypothetical protein
MFPGSEPQQQQTIKYYTFPGSEAFNIHISHSFTSCLQEFIVIGHYVDRLEYHTEYEMLLDIRLNNLILSYLI